MSGAATAEVSSQAANERWRGRSSFVNQLERLPLSQLEQVSREATTELVDRALANKQPDLRELAALLSATAAEQIESLAASAQALTRQRFGKTVQLFAPLYLSNECVNTCLYCGFSRQNKIARKTLTVEQVEAEAKLLAERGFRHLLLVSAEHPRLVSQQYLAECIEATGRHVASVQIEVQAQELETYRFLKEAGCDGVVIYQETYDRDAYERLHTHGLKRDIDNRLDAPDRIGQAGIRHLGLGALLGLSKHWQRDVLVLIAHARYIQKRYWRTQLTVSLPRLKPAAGEFAGPVTLSEHQFLQAICTLRVALPEAGIILSTRERPELRDALIGIGVTHMSAGSSTEPGGYAHAGEAEGQFAIDDARSPQQVAEAISALGYEPVWKDWQRGI